MNYLLLIQLQIQLLLLRVQQLQIQLKDQLAIEAQLQTQVREQLAKDQLANEARLKGVGVIEQVEVKLLGAALINTSTLEIKGWISEPAWVTFRVGSENKAVYEWGYRDSFTSNYITGTVKNLPSGNKYRYELRATPLSGGVETESAERYIAVPCTPEQLRAKSFVCPTN